MELPPLVLTSTQFPGGAYCWCKQPIIPREVAGWNVFGKVAPDKHKLIMINLLGDMIKYEAHLHI